MVYYYLNAEHNCGYLASLGLRTKVAMVENREQIKSESSGQRKSKRARANTASNDIE